MSLSTSLCIRPALTRLSRHFRSQSSGRVERDRGDVTDRAAEINVDGDHQFRQAVTEDQVGAVTVASDRVIGREDHPVRAHEQIDHTAAKQQAAGADRPHLDRLLVALVQRQRHVATVGAALGERQRQSGGVLRTTSGATTSRPWESSLSSVPSPNTWSSSSSHNHCPRICSARSCRFSYPTGPIANRTSVPGGRATTLSEAANSVDRAACPRPHRSSRAG